MNRSPGRQAVFRSGLHRRLFLSLLGEISDVYGAEVHAYCLMENEYHLLVRTPQRSLSQAMRHLNSVYTQRFNSAERKDGPLFRGRYKAVLVEADSYLAPLSRYIHLIPVTARIVKKAEYYRWSSYPAFLGKVQGPEWLHMKSTFGRFGRQGATKRYKGFVEKGIDEEIGHFYGKRNLPSVLGNPKQLKRPMQRRRGRGPPPLTTGFRRHDGRPTLREILQATAKHFNVDKATLCQSARGRRGGSTARMVAMALCRRLGGYPLTEIAKIFKVGNISTVSAAAKRLQSRLGADAGLVRKVTLIRAELFAE
jgi:REP element-mobilizing transposase RayT